MGRRGSRAVVPVRIQRICGSSVPKIWGYIREEMVASLCQISQTKSPHPKKRSTFFVACLFHQLSRWSGLNKQMPAVYGWKNQHPTILHKPAFLLSLSTHFDAFLRWQGYVFWISVEWWSVWSQPAQPVRSAIWPLSPRCQWQNNTLVCDFCNKTNFNAWL